MISGLGSGEEWWRESPVYQPPGSENLSEKAGLHWTRPASAGTKRRQAIWRRNMASASDRVTPAMASSGQSRGQAADQSNPFEEDPLEQHDEVGEGSMAASHWNTWACSPPARCSLRGSPPGR